MITVTNGARNQSSLEMKKDEKIRHAAIWSLLYCAMVFVTYKRYPEDILITILVVTSNVILYATAFYLLLLKTWPRWHINKILSVLYNTCVILMFITVYLLFEYYKVTFLMERQYSLSEEIAGGIVVAIIIEIVSLGVYLQKYAIARIKKISQQEINLLRAREAVISQELAFYKSEFNTHITFNTLSHVYSKVMDDPDVSSSILILSDILRYNLREKADQEVPITKEIKYLQNFIDLYSILFPDLEVSFTVEGSAVDTTKILPRILINFVENAIKHGVRNDDDHPIVIKLCVEENIDFIVKNRKNYQRNNTVSTLTGLKNTRQSLNAYYPDCHRLTIDDERDYYQVHLEIIKVSSQISRIRSSPATENALSL